MKSICCAIIIFFSFASCKTQLVKHKNPMEVFSTDNNALLGVKSKNFRGTIFTDKYSFRLLHVSDIDSSKRFTPNLEQLQKVEYILSKNIKSINYKRTNQTNGNPIIHNNLNKYFRQYIGFITKEGDVVIHINLFWDEYSLIDKLKGYHDNRLKHDSDYARVFDGGSYYWQINVNLTRNQLSNLQVNGTS